MSKVGKILKIQHSQAFGRALRKTKPVYVVITLEYSDGDVQAKGSTDTWNIVPSKDPRAQFETTA